uniref:Uncharacterized protein n=1 Tax=Candidatus Kentrum sp. SD TaxID=2126332 RepID=A0A451BNN6_9GAMM|nr:MAG: hypothetical protein BECKSD772D_GA0070982_10742 [Candidatus Kentron sp. SD]
MTIFLLPNRREGAPLPGSTSFQFECIPCACSITESRRFRNHARPSGSLGASG